MGRSTVGKRAVDVPPKVRFSIDSPLEEAGFELLVPRRIDDAFETALFASAALPVPPERPTRFERGTGGSNPLCSSEESSANLTIRGRTSRWPLSGPNRYRCCQRRPSTSLVDVAERA